MLTGIPPRLTNGSRPPRESSERGVRGGRDVHCWPLLIRSWTVAGCGRGTTNLFGRSLEAACVHGLVMEFFTRTFAVEVRCVCLARVGAAVKRI